MRNGLGVPLDVESEGEAVNSRIMHRQEPLIRSWIGLMIGVSNSVVSKWVHVPRGMCVLNATKDPRKSQSQSEEH
jgi:predicted transcriptional regulator